MLEQKKKTSCSVFNLCSRKCLNKQYTAQSRVCFPAGRAPGSLEQRTESEGEPGQGGGMGGI